MGKRVILSGWGGDEGIAFNGRGYFAELLLRGQWITMVRELALRTRIHGDDFWGSFKSRAILPILPDSLLKRLRPDLLEIVVPRPLPLRFLQPAFANQLTKVEPYPYVVSRERPGARKYQIELFHDGHITHRLESWADNGGYRETEYRYPLLDRRIVELALTIPVRLFHHRGWKRYLFREATSGLLPEAVQWKKHKGEPGRMKAITAIFDEVGYLKMPALESRKAQIASAGYIQEDAFYNGLRQSLDRLPEPDGVLKLIWLALLD